MRLPLRLEKAYLKSPVYLPGVAALGLRLQAAGFALGGLFTNGEYPRCKAFVLRHRLT